MQQQTHVLRFLAFARTCDNLPVTDGRFCTRPSVPRTRVQKNSRVESWMEEIPVLRCIAYRWLIYWWCPLGPFFFLIVLAVYDPGRR